MCYYYSLVFPFLNVILKLLDKIKVSGFLSEPKIVCISSGRRTYFLSTQNPLLICIKYSEIVGCTVLDKPFDLCGKQEILPNVQGFKVCALESGFSFIFILLIFTVHIPSLSFSRWYISWWKPTWYKHQVMKNDPTDVVNSKVQFLTLFLDSSNISRVSSKATTERCAAPRESSDLFLSNLSVTWLMNPLYHKWKQTCLYSHALPQLTLRYPRERTVQSWKCKLEGLQQCCGQCWWSAKEERKRDSLPHFSSLQAS